MVTEIFSFLSVLCSFKPDATYTHHCLAVSHTKLFSIRNDQMIRLLGVSCLFHMLWARIISILIESGEAN